MSTQFGGARYIPILGAVVAILLVASLWLILTQPDPAPASGGKANQLLAANTAVLQAEDALSGDAAAFDSLDDAIERLRWLDTQSLNEDEVTAIKSLIAALGSVRNGREALTALFASADDLDSLSAQLTDQTYALQGALTLQQQPQVTAQLERLRLIGGVLAKDVRSLAAGAGGSMLLTQQILDSEMALTQIVRGFQSGDPELGLQPLSAGGPVDALDAVAMTASAISDKVKDVLAVADQLLIVDQARAQLSGLAVLREPVAAPTAVGNADSGTYELAARLLIAAIVVFLGVAWMYYRSAGMRREAAVQAEKTDRNQKAIQRLLDELDSLADGDLTVNATVTEDITGAIADSINYAIEALRELVTTLNVSAITVDGAAKQTDETAQQLTTASDSLSKQIDAASQAIAVMASSIEEVSGNAERSSDVARHSVAVAHKGGDAVRRTIEGMNTIRETIQETSKRIKRLGESSQEIGNIVELINDIADQTNILALNASIQASMAGEAGRGFAVVADEVQRLAERSANATKQIEVLVRTIQADTNEAVVSMERSTTDVVGGALLAENAGAALEEIEQVSNQIASLVQNISSSARDQAKSAEAVTLNMDELQEINSQTAAGTRQTTKSIRELAELAAQLRSAVAGFRLPDPGNPPASGSADGGGAREGEEGAGSSDDDGDSEDEVHFADQQTA